MIRRRRKGSVSVFLLLLLAALLPVLHLHLVAAGRRMEDQALTRALTAQAQVSLAAYDKNLQHHYGLLGFLPQKIDRSVFAASLDGVLPAPPLDWHLQKPLSQPEVMLGQIQDFMRPRLPGVLIERSLIALDQLQTSGEPAAEALGEAQGYLSGIDPDAAKQARDGLFDSSLGSVEDEVYQNLASVYRRVATELAGASPCDIFGSLPDFFDPSSFAGSLSRLESRLTAEQGAFTQRILPGEYVLGTFPSAVTVRKSGGQIEPIHSLNQTPMHELPVWRDRQVEQILTGLSAKPAGLVTRGVILSLRAGLHVGETIGDRATMNALRAAAVGLSGLVAAASGGSLVIKPEIMTYFLVVGRALMAAFKDTEKLLDGRAVALWPDESVPTPKLFYDDYLRFYLWSMPHDLMLPRIHAQITIERPGPYYTVVGLETKHRGQRLLWQEGYP